jgi:dTDP-4-amino-4,6-dideoxygalactose transaminase
MLTESIVDALATGGRLMLGLACAELEAYLSRRWGYACCAVVASPTSAVRLVDTARPIAAGPTIEVVDLGPRSRVAGIGEAAAILTDDDELDARIRLLRNHGQDGRHRFLHHVVGFNSRMDEVAARYLLRKFGVA